MLSWVANAWSSRFRAQAKETTFPDTTPPNTQFGLDEATKDNCAWFGIPENEVLECKVIDVYDGDTITVILPFCGRFFKSKCRLLGIDSPEIRTRDPVEKTAALAAREWLRHQILNQRVWLQCKGYDKYGRLLADVYPHNWVQGGGKMLFACPSYNERLLQEGYAVAYDGGTKKPFVAAVGPLDDDV